MNNQAYPIESWDAYARSHASVLTSYQWALFREAAKCLQGDVVDCGCGTARLAPLLADQSRISSYTGVDCSPDMVTMAQWIISRLNTEKFRIVEGRIEAIEGSFSAAVSIHSYYSWPDSALVLDRIYNVLSPGGVFVLATPNNSLDMLRLLYESEKELLAHPDFDAFRRWNLEFAENPQARFVSMDRLVKEVRSVGFRIVSCHQQHYLGGVNFLILHRR